METNISTEFSDTVLFPILRRGMGVSNEPVDLSEKDCKDLFQFGRRQSLLPVISQGIKKVDIPDEWKKQFNTGVARDLRAYVLRDYSLQQISNALDTGSIPYIFLKGSVIRDLYPEAWMRTSSDIDVLVHEEDLEQAIEAIEAATDYRAQRKDFHDVSMLSGYFHLELHFTIKENDERLDSLLTNVWNYAVATGDGMKYSLTPDFQVFHVVAHMSHHFVHGGLGIRPFIDLWLLRHKTRFDENTVQKMCESCGILKFYKESCKLADHWMGKTPIGGMTLQFSNQCLLGGVFGSPELSHIMRQKEKTGLNYLLSRAFKLDDNVRELFKDESGKKHGYLYYQVKRWKYWLSKKKRQELTRQAQGILMTDKESIESTHSLLSWLEL